MVETLTESFCERCGTRYEFKAPTRLNPLRRTRGFIGGLKNYLTSQDSFGDALGDSMRLEEDQLAAAQLEAFHESFNFCISCRQYTCLNCWNDGEGRCRTCAPVPGTDDVAERLAASFAAGSAVAPAPAGAAGAFADDPTMAQEDIQRRLGLDAWPSIDVPTTASGTNGSAGGDWPSADEIAVFPESADVADVEPELVVVEEPEPVVAEVEPEPVAAEAEPEPELVVAEVEPESVAAEAEPEPEPELVVAEVEPEPRPNIRPIHVVAWDDDVLPVAAEEPEPVGPAVEPEPVFVEVEPEPVAAQLEPEPEPVLAAEAEPVPAEEPEPVVIVEVGSQPVLAEAEPESEPVPADEAEPMAATEETPEPVPAPAPRIAPISETILRFPRQGRPEPATPAEEVAAAADSPEVAARRAQLELLGLDDSAEGPVAPQRPAVLPYRSRGAAPSRVELAASAGGGFWEASAREVAGAAANIGVQNCGHCGLSLSASARFCRRCGTRQAQSA